MFHYCRCSAAPVVKAKLLHCRCLLSVTNSSILQVISANPDASSSFIVQWGLRCWPENGKYKCLEPSTSAESTKIDVFLGQFGSTASEIKLKCVTFAYCYSSLVHYVFLLGNFLEIFETVLFWKRYGIRDQKSDVGIFTDTFMVAILDYKTDFDPFGS